MPQWRSILESSPHIIIAWILCVACQKQLSAILILLDMIRTWGTCFDLASKDGPQRGNIPKIYLRRGVTVLQVSLDLDRTRLDKTYLFCFGCPSLLYKTRGSAHLRSTPTVLKVISQIQQWTLPTPILPLTPKSVDVHQWLVPIVVRANSRSVNLFPKSHTLAHIIPVSSGRISW